MAQRVVSLGDPAIPDREHPRRLRPPRMNCSFPGCSATSPPFSSPLMKVDGLKCSKVVDYLCMTHNRCFYCKEGCDTYHRVCSPCFDKREQRRRLRALPPPLVQRMSDCIMKKTGLPRDIINLIGRYLLRIDQVMWAIACGSSWERRGQYTKQALFHGTSAQMLWFLKQGCLPKQSCTEIIKRLTGGFPVMDALKHVRCYHAAMEKRYDWNVMAEVNLCNWAGVHLSVPRKASEIGVDEDSCQQYDKERAEQDKKLVAFLKWNFLLLNERDLRVADRSSTAIDYLIQNGYVDLLIWLYSERCETPMATPSRIREAEERMDFNVLRFFVMTNQKKMVDTVLEKIILHHYLHKKWERLRFLLEVGVAFPANLITDADWKLIDLSMMTACQSDRAWTMLRLLAEAKHPLTEASVIHLVVNGYVDVVRKLVEMKFKMPHQALEVAIQRRIHSLIDVFLGTGMQLGRGNMLAVLVSGDLETLKLYRKHGYRFVDLDLAEARLRYHHDVTAFIEASIEEDKQLK